MKRGAAGIRQVSVGINNVPLEQDAKLFDRKSQGARGLAFRVVPFRRMSSHAYY